VVTAPLGREFDDDNADGVDDDDDSVPELEPISDTDDELSKAVGKVYFNSDSDESF
jgi:hypothetical protein